MNIKQLYKIQKDINDLLKGEITLKYLAKKMERAIIKLRLDNGDIKKQTEELFKNLWSEWGSIEEVNAILSLENLNDSKIFSVNNKNLRKINDGDMNLLKMSIRNSLSIIEKIKNNTKKLAKSSAM